MIEYDVDDMDDDITGNEALIKSLSMDLERMTSRARKSQTSYSLSSKISEESDFIGFGYKHDSQDNIKNDSFQYPSSRSRDHSSGALKSEWDRSNFHDRQRHRSSSSASCKKSHKDYMNIDNLTLQEDNSGVCMVSSRNMSLALPTDADRMMESLKSPISPTSAGIHIPSTDLCLATGPGPSSMGAANAGVLNTSAANGTVTRSKTLHDHQDHRICFGMDQSLETSHDPDWFARDFGGTPRKRFDSNGNNRKLNLSYDESSGVSSCGTAEAFQPTHRATHQFIPRHDDEILLDVGDPVYVEHEAEDLWFTGTNLRTGQRGIFPVAYAFEIDFEEECGPMSSLRLKLEDKATFYVTLLGTVEVAHHKGNDVLVQAINKVLNVYQNREEIVVPHSVLLDVSFRGIHIIDKSRKNWFQCPSFDYFYSLQNISFCGAHPKQLRYFGFITKHPLLPRFACHVFLSNSTTQPIVDAIGRAFRRSYDEYMAFAHPTEDIFID